MAYEITKEAMAEHLSGMVKFATVSQNNDSDMDFEPFFAMFRYFEETYPLLHAALEREIVGAGSLLYRWKGTGRSGNLPLMFMAHLDVVPEGDPGKWKYPPYSGVIAEGQVWGRGSGDCKSNICAQMEAIEHLISIGYQPDVDIYLAYGYNEEVGSGKGAASGAYQIAALLEQRGVRLGGILDEGSGLKLDKSFDTPTHVCSITLGEKGYADFEISRSDPGGHSMSPGKQGAMYYIAKAILAIEDHPFPYRLTDVMRRKYAVMAPYLKDERLRTLFADPDANWEELVPLIDADRSLAPMFHTTMAVTMASGSVKENILPEKASIVVNCRLLDGDTLESVQAYLESILPEGVDVRLLRGNNASPVSKFDCDFKDLLVEICRDRCGDENMLVVPGLLGGGTDAKNMYNISDCVYRFSSFFSTGASGGAHQVNEHQDIDELVTGPEFYIELIKRYSAREIRA